MHSSTLRTLPATHRKVDAFQCIAAFGAPFGRWIPFVDADQSSTIPVCFVLKLSHQFTPTNIAYGFGKLGVLNHVLHLKRLDTDYLVFVDQCGCQLVQEVLATVCNFGVNSGHLQFCFLEICRTFLLLAQTTLVLCQPYLIFVGMSWVAGFPASRGGNGILNTKINSDCARRNRQLFNIGIAKQGDKVTTGAIFGDCHGCWLVWDFPAPANIQRLLVLCQRQLTIDPPESGASVFSTLNSAFLLECRVFCPAIPKVFKSCLQVSECLLSGYARDFVEPEMLWAFLQGSESTGRFVIANALLLVVPSIRPESQSPVIDKTYTAERVSKLSLLFGSRVKPEFVRFLNHTYTISCFCVKLKTTASKSTGFHARFR